MSFGLCDHLSGESINNKKIIYKRLDGSWYFSEPLSPWLDANLEFLLPDRSFDYAHLEIGA
jgi:hypothetical protein